MKKKPVKRTNWKQRALLLQDAIKLSDDARAKLECEAARDRAELEDARAKLGLTEQLVARLEAKARRTVDPTPDPRFVCLWIVILAALELVVIVAACATR